MTNLISRLTVASVVMALIFPTAAFAEVSALQVWDSWRSYAESFGQTISVGSQEVSGDALILRDVTTVLEFPEGRVSGTLALLEFRERGDGTVAVTMATDFPFSVTVDPEDGEAADLAVIFRQSGSSIIASGTDGDITFDYLASEISFEIDKLVVDGQEIDAVVRFAMGSIDGKYALTAGEDRTYSSQLAADSARFEVSFTDPDEGGEIDITGTIEDLRSNSNVTIPEDFDPANPGAIFGGGFNVQGAFETGPSGYDINLENGPESFSLTTFAASNSLEFSILDGTINYGGAANAVSYTVRSPQIPLPEVTLSIAEMAFNLLAPFTKSDEPEEFAFLMKIAGLEISEMIWGMIDPAQVMPRDPATIIIDINGQMNWLIDITDPEQTDAFTGDSPAELHRITINDITFAAVGAEITGGGEFTFDNADLETFSGMPAPTGLFEMRLMGLNGLLDRFIQLGLLPSDQAVGMRMMMGLFARPADGEDTMTSTIEVNGDGSVFANGQQLQ